MDDVLRAGKAGSFGRGGLPFGQYTDDTQLARELCQSVAEHGSFTPEGYAPRVAAIFTEERIVGRGRATENAARRLAAGVRWDEAGEPAPSAGNGSAMRAGPIGWLFPEDRSARDAAAHDQGRITHRDPRCSAGAAIVASAVAMAMREPFDAAALLEEAAQSAEGFDADFGALVRSLPVALPPPEAVAIVGPAGKPAGYDDGWRGISPFVVPSVLWSLYAFLRHPDDYWEAVCLAIRVGGDVDTTAAMTGAISGARLGEAALPELADRVTDQGTWGRAELSVMARSLG